MSRPTVSLCMIVRDEEKNLPQCLQGLAGAVSEMIIVDTGSQDATRKIAADLGAKVFDFPWIDDFSAARNESVRHASGDYIFWMDADDRLDPENLRRVVQLLGDLEAQDPSRNTVFLMSSISRPPGKSEVGATHVRLFPNRPAITWAGRVHERLEYGKDATSLKYVQTNIVIRHDGYSDSVRYAQKRHRNARILEQEFVANPDDLFNLFYLGRVRNWQGNMPEAVRFLKRSIRLDPRCRAFTTPYAYLLAAESLRKLNRVDEALRMLDEGLLHLPDFAPLLFSKASLLRDTNHFSESIVIFRKLLTFTPEQLRDGAMWFDLKRDRWRLMIGNMLHALGRDDEARIEYQHALNECSDSLEGWFALGQLDVHFGRTAEAAKIVHHLERLSIGCFESLLLRAQICVLEARCGEAHTWLDRAATLRPDDVGIHIIRSVLLFREASDWQQCLEAHETVLRLDPHHTETRRRIDHVRAKAAAMKRPTVLPGWTPDMSSPLHPVEHFNLDAAHGLAFSC